jgi:hypothetical protein
METEFQVTTSTFDAARIAGIIGLDPVTVIYRDDKGAGMVFVECYGETWSTYFGSIGPRSLVNFVASVHPDYLANRLRRNKQTKAEEAYLLRVADAAIHACKSLAQSEAA